MKNLFQFLKEADKASLQARKLNLKSDGHGGWLDSKGEFVAKTEGGKLKFYNQRQRAGKDPNQVRPSEGPVQQMAKRRADDDLAGAPLQKKPAPEQSPLDKTLDTLTIVFGRFNPPTIGHQKLFQTAEKLAAGGDLKIYPSRTQDSKKNPLDPDMKASYMRKMFPDYEEEIINDKAMNTIFDVLTTANKEGYKNINIVVGGDRQSEFESLAQKYNGDLYDFDLIRTISAGVRDPDAEGVEGMSASKMRKAVMDGDEEEFKKGLPDGVDAADGQALFDAVRQGMKASKAKKKDVEEEVDLWMVAPKLDPRGLRENYMMGNIFNMGELVENLNTGLIGKIIRRGTNYLICVTEGDNMFKSWIHDVMEYTEKRMERRMRDKTHTNTLIGTGGYRKNAQSSVPGQKKIRNFNIEEFINKYKLKTK